MLFPSVFNPCFCAIAVYIGIEILLVYLLFPLGTNSKALMVHKTYVVSIHESGLFSGRFCMVMFFRHGQGRKIRLCSQIIRDSPLAKGTMLSQYKTKRFYKTKYHSLPFDHIFM